MMARKQPEPSKPSAASKALDDANQARKSLEVIFETTLNSITDGMYFLDADWRFTYVNPRAEEIAQRSKEELIGNSLWEMFPLMRGSEFGIGYNRARAEQTKVVVRERYEPYGVVLEATAYPTGDGLAIYVRDVTDEEETLKTLAERDRRIASQAALLDSARDAIIVRRLDHTIEYWNKAASDLYGWSVEEAVGQSIRELLYASTDEFDVATASAIANGEWAGDIEQLSRDGRMIIADSRWSLVCDADGNPEAIFAVNSDVTERRRHEELALRAQRMESLGTLAGGIAHDFNNVLTPLLMSVQMLSADETNPDKLATLGVIETSAKRGADMIRQVLAFARGVEGRRIHVETARLIADIEAFCREALPASIQLSIDIAPDTLDTVGDPTQLLQVLLNLVANARDAMPGGGELRISTRTMDVDDPFRFRLPASGHYLLIDVEDSGTGMPDDVTSKVFEPFFTTKGFGGGTGLGLATSIAIVRSHGGNIQVYSEAGVGSRFEIFLPGTATGLPRATGTPITPAMIPRGSGQLVLIVDDEPAIRHTVRRTLEGHGYQAAVAANGEEALEYLKTFPGRAALVFTDITMPVMGGVELLTHLDQHHPELPVVLSSGLTTTTPQQHAANGAARSFLAKPYTTVELLSTMVRMLGL